MGAEIVLTRLPLIGQHSGIGTCADEWRFSGHFVAHDHIRPIMISVYPIRINTSIGRDAQPRCSPSISHVDGLFYL